MKTHNKQRYLLIIALVIVSLILALINVGKNSAGLLSGENKNFTDSGSSRDKSNRESITFILGEDEPERAPYYALAFDYYKSDKEARTEYIDTTCKSLTEVRDYLKDNPPGNGRPWGLINLVSHGNEYYGMSVPVAPGSKRSSTERLTEYVHNGEFESLSDSLVDDSTEIFLHGCGLGKDQDLLKIVARAFGGEKKQPAVRASKLKEYYSSVSNSGQVLRSQLFYANTWSVYYKFKERPDDDELLKEFTENYPGENIDWASALTRTSSIVPGDLFHYTINVSVYYAIQYKSTDTLPDLSTQAKKLKWVQSQNKLLKILSKSKIPAEKFKWTTQKAYGEGKNKNNPLIHISGWCTVLCVVKPLVTEQNDIAYTALPFLPPMNDTTYFGVEPGI
jgi:hypothetical protein